ncbi:POP1-domain-containing protein [Piedraia hortae CBS 480.64]|uniref:POP1-domain-containing protein n=1 Tax=Piedraia hortae CBS 480.64 TaxID=1314780 RepID=A0A6A7BXG2_9PEZI|nr:POP1-domain-containing protein [Piedraia hortae CBS 480.64]
MDKNNKRSAPPLERATKKPKNQDARQISTQTTTAAFKGELDVDSFVRARDFEISALEEGMKRSKKALNQRAFQQVPKELRRRTASHNVKKIPKRLRPRAQQELEMAKKDDKSVSAREEKRGKKEEKKKRQEKKTRQKMQRIETARKLRSKDAEEVETQPPKTKQFPSVPLIGRADFRKRQKDKSWLPTHIYHAKRAHMCVEYGYSLPESPTAKCYRVTHRASRERGAVAFDTSYITTFGLDGDDSSLCSVLKAVGIDVNLESSKGKKWRKGLRTLEGWIHKHDDSAALLAPVNLIWCGSKVLGRVHPAADASVMDQLEHIASSMQPPVLVENLTSKVGSMEVFGPCATETLLGVLHPCTQDTMVETFKSLSGLTNTALLPNGALLQFDIHDPRLYYPPRTYTPPSNSDTLLQTAEVWPPDAISTTVHSNLSERFFQPCSQKSIDRRKALAGPGAYPEPTPTDPQIPVIMYTTPQKSWTLLLPRGFVLPAWRCVMDYPLITGTKPRFGGLDEYRQINFEGSRPIFPCDFPSTLAGKAWNTRERAKHEKVHNARPKAKRKNLNKEVGDPFGCDWERIVSSENLVTVEFTLLSKGRPEYAARVYSLPQSANERDAWVRLLPSKSSKGQMPPRDASRDTLERMLTSVPKAGEPKYPPCPGEECLMGFVTYGNYDLARGQGKGIGALVPGRIPATAAVEAGDSIQVGSRGETGNRLCIIRNSGEDVGRLARWKVMER